MESEKQGLGPQPGGPCMSQRLLEESKKQRDARECPEETRASGLVRGSGQRLQRTGVLAACVLLLMGLYV